MDVVRFATAFGRLEHHLTQRGYAVEECREFSSLSDLLGDAGKPYLTHMSSPEHNDFTANNVLWFVARRHGKIAIAGCARLENIGSEPISAYWSRVFRRAYGTDRGGPIIENVARNVDDTVSGKVVYFGDLYVAPHVRGSRPLLRAFVAMGHLAVALKWNPDWTYCFIKEKSVLRGAAMLYGFPRVFGRPFHWVNDPPEPRSREEWMVGLHRNDLEFVSSEAVAAILKSGDQD